MLPSIEYRWHAAIKRSNPELFSLRVAGIALRLGVYDKRVPGGSSIRSLDGNSAFVFGQGREVPTPVWTATVFVRPLPNRSDGGRNCLSSAMVCRIDHRRYAASN